MCYVNNENLATYKELWDLSRFSLTFFLHISLPGVESLLQKNRSESIAFFGWWATRSFVYQHSRILLNILVPEETIFYLKNI